MALSIWKGSVTVKRAPIKTKNGQQVRDWDSKNVVTKTVDDCQLTPQATSREFEGRVTNVTDRRTLRAPYEADIQEGDRIIWNGDTYEIDGEVFHTQSPAGGASSTRCTIVRWRG